MSLAGAILLIVTGLAVMALGLFLFYAWLPLLYGFVGFDIGLLLGRWLTGDIGIIAIILGVAGAVVLALLSYSLEPYRRILLGISGGVLIGLALAAGFGLDGTLGTIIGSVLAVALGLIGGSVVPRYFDLFVIFATAVSGAGMVMTSAYSNARRQSSMLKWRHTSVCPRHRLSGGRRNLAVQQHHKMDKCPICLYPRFWAFSKGLT